MTYGGSKGIWENIGGLKQDAVNEQVKFAVEAGINFIDTANVYSVGNSETLLGQALKTLALPREQLIIATKATGSMVVIPLTFSAETGFAQIRVPRFCGAKVLRI